MNLAHVCIHHHIQDMEQLHQLGKSLIWYCGPCSSACFLLKCLLNRALGGELDGEPKFKKDHKGK